MADISINVIGGGSWGTAITHLLANKGYPVTLWVHEPELARQIESQRRNPIFLPGITLPRNVQVTSDLAALPPSPVFVMAVPSQYMRQVARRMKNHIGPDTTLVCVSKGIEKDSLKYMSQVLAEELAGRTGILSGPSFAKEVAQQLPTAVVVASREPDTALQIQQIFNTDYFRVYTNSDIIGVQIGGSLKNVIAIAAGISDGLGFGLNTRATLITRGLAEITRLGVAMGASPRTFSGLAGMGDLVLTCTGALSRNRTVGLQIGQGKTLNEILNQMKMVAEGVDTAESAAGLARKYNVEMPIAQQTYKVLFEGLSPRQAVQNLMSRELKDEFA